MTLDDILNREIVRLQGFVENRKVPFLSRLSHSKPALITLAATVLIFQLRGMPELLANSSLDAAIAIQRPVQPKSVRLVTIDDQDYAAMFHSRSPLDTDVLSKILAAVAKGHPRAIIVDIDTSDPSFNTMPVPQVPIVWNVSGTQQADGNFTIDAPLAGQPLTSGSVAALAIVPRDDRGIVRGYQPVYPLESGGTADAPGYAASRIVAGNTPASPATQEEVIHYLDYRYRFVPIAARDIITDAASDSWEKVALFSGQVVVVGGAYQAARDQYATPRGLLNGCEIVAQTAAAEIDGTYISSANRWMTGLIMIFGGLVTLAIYHWFSFRHAFIASLAMIPALSILSNWILFHRFAAWGAMVPLVVAVIVAELYSKAALYLAFYERMATLKTKEPAAVEETAPVSAKK